MGRGYLPAHVSHVGGAASAIPAVPVYDEIPERRFQKLLFPVAAADICGDGLKPFLIQLSDHGLEFPRIIQFLLRVSNGDHTLQIFLDQIIESLVIDQVRISGHLFDIHGGSSDQSCSPGNVAHAFKQLLYLGHLGRADGIKDLGLRRDHVGGDAAGIGDGSMDPGRIDHVLSHIVDANVHDLHRIQGRPA